MDPIQQCAQLIQKAGTMAVLTGAGISTSAGIPDFRGPRGLYVTRQYDPDKVFEINYFRRDPKPFFDFARDFLGLESKIEPTFTHFFLSRLEQRGKLKGIVTQNIDALHTRAGSKKVFEMHGSFLKSHCLDCGEEFSYDQLKTRLLQEDVPSCACKGVIKPDIVFFGEDVKYLAESERLARDAELFFIIGTSCAVYPAALLPHFVTGDIIVVNQDKVNAQYPHISLDIREDINHFFKKVAVALNLKDIKMEVTHGRTID